MKILTNRFVSPAAFILLALGAPLTHGATVGWNYLGVGGVGLGASDLAGAPGFEQDNWNNHAGAGQGPGSTPLTDLLDDSGATTTIDVASWTLTANNSWQHSQTANPNEVLMNDFSNQQPSLVFDQIPYLVYDVVVYYGNNEGPTTSTLTVGAFSRTITTGDTALSSFGSVGFVEGTDLNTLSPTNYSVFTGLGDSNLTISLTGPGNNGISAIQIVQIPEPAAAGLLGIGLLLAAFRRRR